jgi:hypothetical protein
MVLNPASSWCSRDGRALVEVFDAVALQTDEMVMMVLFTKRVVDVTLDEKRGCEAYLCQHFEQSVYCG